jgi:hypothetical protein
LVELKSLVTIGIVTIYHQSQILVLLYLLSDNIKIDFIFFGEISLVGIVEGLQDIG